VTTRQLKRKTEGSALKTLVPDSGAHSVERTGDYGRLVSDISGLLEQARRAVARSTNSVLTATYWEIGRRIVEFEQGGKARAEYGEQLLARLANDLMAEHGRGFSERNLRQMRTFYVEWEIRQTPSAEFEVRVKLPTPEGKSDARKRRTPPVESGRREQPAESVEFTRIRTDASAPIEWAARLPGAFPLSWSQYVRLMSVTDPYVRAFYELEAVRGGWSVRQLDRQISTQFCERALASKRRDDFLARGRLPRPEDRVSVEEEIRDPYLLEFLNLKDEYGENDLEEALVRHLEWFLLEMGLGFTFVARQKRIRVGDSWYRIDLLLYHRGLRCLVVIDLKRGRFSHADAGQMNLYLNFVKEHMMMPGESDPVGIILCDRKDEAVVKYATGGIRAKVFASKYLTVLPAEKLLQQEILKTRRMLETRCKEEKTDA